jgi:heme/copper-type cytochrome/quinol oxidase subunit 2
MWWLRASAALFLTSALISGTHWLQLMDERSSAAGYEVQIAVGLPVTVTASITGFAIVLALLMMTHQDEHAAEHQTKPSSAQSDPN